MPIFALVVIVLFAATGFAVDAGVAYLSYNGAERAAAAAALAGVTYMPAGLPSTYTGTTPDTTCNGPAAAAACAASARDGLSNGGTVNGHNVSVSVSRYPATCTGTLANPCADNKLTVQVTAWVQPTFLRVLGFSDHQVTAGNTAFFLPPISLGQPGPQLGSTIDQLGTSSNYYFLRSEGYGNPRGEGDAFDPNPAITTYSSPTCAVSETTGPPAGSGDSTDVHALSANLKTDVADSGYTGGAKPLPEAGGYDYTLSVPASTTSYPLVYNPAFAPDGGANSATSGYNLHEQDSSFSGNTYSDQYSAMEYTLYSVSDRFDHTSDIPVSQVIVDPLNITYTGSSITQIVDVNNGQTLNATTNAAAFAKVRDLVYHQWVNIGSPNTAATAWTSGGVTYNVFTVNKLLAAGTLTGAALTGSLYRMRVDMLDYHGLRPVEDANASPVKSVPCSRAHKGYAIQLGATANGSSSCATCQVSALDELAVYTPVVASGTSGFSVPLFQLPADYAGQTVNFYIFDPGDVTGTNTISIVNPDDASCGGAGQGGCTFTSATGSPVPIYDLGYSRATPPTVANSLIGGDNTCSSTPVQSTTAPYQAAVTTATVTGCGRSGAFFNGRWLLFQLQIPSTYAGGYTTTAGADTYWKLHYSLVGGTASDTFTIAVNYANSPVHLL